MAKSSYVRYSLSRMIEFRDARYLNEFLSDTHVAFSPYRFNRSGLTTVACATVATGACPNRSAHGSTGSASAILRVSPSAYCPYWKYPKPANSRNSVVKAVGTAMTTAPTRVSTDRV